MDATLLSQVTRVSLPARSMFATTPVYKAGDGEIVFGLRQPGVLPAGGDVLATVTAATEDRLDLVSARLLGDPSAWWAIADCSNLVDPLAGTVAGLSLRVPSTTRLPS